MATPAHVLVSSTAVTTSLNSLTITGLPQNYRDLIMVIAGKGPGGQTGYVRVNDNTSAGSGNNYDLQTVERKDAAVTSRSNSSAERAYLGFNQNAWTGSTSQIVIRFCDYSNTNHQKLMLSASDSGADAVNFIGNLWKSNDAINRIFFGAGLLAGSTVRIYGIVGEEA